VADKSYKPMYKQIKDKILNDIINQVYKPGEIIPSQNEFAKNYGVSRVTVQQAFNELIYSGILYTQKGKGTFVSDLPTDNYNDRISGFSASVERIGYKAYTKVLAIENINANKKLSDALKIEMGQAVIHLKRLRSINDIFVALENSFLPYSMVSQINFDKDKFENKSLYQNLSNNAGIVFGYAEEKIRAIVSSDEVASLLKIDSGEPLLYVKRKTYDIQGQPFEYCENYLRSDIYGISIRMNFNT